MKIAILHPKMHARGGAENLILWFAREAVRQGHAVRVESIAPAVPWPDEVGFAARELDLRLWKWTRLARELTESLAGEDLVIVHSFPASIYAEFARSRLARRAVVRPRFVWYCHEPPRPYYGDHPEEARTLARRRLLRLDFGGMNSIRMDRRAARRADLRLANSARTALHAAFTYGVPFQPVHPGLPDDMVDPAPRPAGRDFVFVGRLHAVKNPLIVIRAYAAFLQRRPQSSAELTLAGEGPALAECRSLVAALGLSRRVHLPGFVSDAALREIFRGALAILNTPRDEPFGLVTLEAWAASRAVVLSRDSGSAEIAADRRDAWLVHPGDESALTEAMICLADEPATAEALGQRGWQRLQGGYLIRHHVDALLRAAQMPGS